MLSDCLAGSQSELIDNALDEALDETFPPGCRKPRHDGWTPGRLRRRYRPFVESRIAAGAGLSYAAPTPQRGE